MPNRFFQIDAFTDQPYRGNPAAVVITEGGREDVWMQKVASEMNLSETAFVWPLPEDAGEDYRIRWFTPKAEVDLCGHATLAAAVALWEESAKERDQAIRFESNSGPLVARWRDGGVELDLPLRKALTESAPPELIEGLGLQPLYCGLSGDRNYLFVVDDPLAVVEAEPDFDVLERLDSQGVILTAAAGTWRPDKETRVDFVSRYFAPSVGIDEDPVTGSAHCTLGPYWAERLGKSELLGWQASARGGLVGVRIEDGAVHLTGGAVVIIDGTLQAT